MLLLDKETNSLIQVQRLEDLINPKQTQVSGIMQAGEDEKTPEDFAKDQLSFPSGESLPRCWVDADYRS